MQELVARLTSLQGWLTEPANIQNVGEVKREGIRIALDRPQEYHPWLRSQTAVALLESYGVEGVNPQEELEQSFRFSDTEDYRYLQSLAQRYSGRIPAVAWIQEQLRVKGVSPDGLAEEVEFRLLEAYNEQWDSGLALLSPDQGLSRKILRQSLGLKMEAWGTLLLGRAWRTGLAATREQLKQEFGKFSTGLLEAGRPSLEDDRSIPSVLNYLLTDGRTRSAQYQARFLRKEAAVSLPAGDHRTMGLDLRPPDQEPPLASVWKEWLSQLVSMAALGPVEVVVHTASAQDFKQGGKILHSVRWKAAYAKDWTHASADLVAGFSRRLQRGMPVWPGTLYHLQIPQGVLPASLARFLESQNWRRQFPAETDGQVYLKVPAGKTLEDRSSSTAGLEESVPEPLLEQEFIQTIQQRVDPHFQEMLDVLGEKLEDLVRSPGDWDSFLRDLPAIANWLDQDSGFPNLARLSEQIDPARANNAPWKKFREFYIYYLREALLTIAGQGFSGKNDSPSGFPERVAATRFYLTTVLPAIHQQLMAATTELPPFETILDDSEWSRLMDLSEMRWNFFYPKGKVPFPSMLETDQGAFQASPLLAAAEQIKRADVNAESFVYDFGSGHASLLVWAGSFTVVGSI